jgi:hypothetical protein
MAVSALHWCTHLCRCRRILQLNRCSVRQHQCLRGAI